MKIQATRYPEGPMGTNLYLRRRVIGLLPTSYLISLIPSYFQVIDQPRDCENASLRSCIHSPVGYIYPQMPCNRYTTADHPVYATGTCDPTIREREGREGSGGGVLVCRLPESHDH